MNSYLTRLILLMVLLAAAPVYASQIIVTTGYANSERPKANGIVVDRLFADGGGYAFGVRVDMQSPLFWYGPSFLFWNNVTGDPDPGRNSTYFQVEVGGRLSVRTRTIPGLYAGVGAGYSLARGDIKTRYADLGYDEAFDGEFPTASIHIGAKTPSRTTGIGVIAEASYHFGLDEPSSMTSIGPARAWMIQIGFALDTKFAKE
jgi:hypothetical protein